MDAAPLDGRDDAGSGDDGSGRDGYETGSRDGERRRPLPAAAGLIGVLVAVIAVLWLLSLTGNDRAGSSDSELDEEPFEVPTTSSPLREPENTIEVAAEGEDLPSAAPAEPLSDLEGRLVYLSGSDVEIGRASCRERG